MVSIVSSIPMLSMIFSLSEVILHNLPADFEIREEICQRYLKVQVQSPWQRVLEDINIGLLSNYCGMVGGVNRLM